jgi:hypothetical protein
MAKNAISACIGRLVKAGKVSAEAGKRAQDIADGIQDSLREELGEAGAEAQAALRAAKILTEAAQAKKAKAAKNAIALEKGRQAVAAHPKGKASGLNAMLTRDVNEKVGGSVESIAETIQGKLLGKIEDAFENFTTRAGGLVRPLHDIRDVVRELYGVDTGSAAAKTFAKGWTEAISYAVDRAKAAGKSFQTLEPWRLPQFWDSTRVKTAGREAWRPGMTSAQKADISREAWKDDIKAAIGRGDVFYFDKDSGLPVTSANIDAKLNEAWEQIVIDEGKGVSSPFNAFSRTFHFKNADAWFRFQDRYGLQSNDLFGTMTGHLKGMAQEIALMERFGPSYRSTFQTLRDEAQAAVKLGKTAKPNVIKMDGIGTADRSFKVLTGEANGVENEAAAGFMGALRQSLSAAQLGGALAISIPSDMFTAVTAAISNGVPVGKVLTRGFWDLFADNAEKRAAAARLDVISHSISDAGLSSMRYGDLDKAPKLFSGLSSFVMRASGMERWTQVMKRAFTMEMLAHVADQGRFAFAKLDPKFREFLERNNFTPAEWDTIRATPKIDVQGAKFFDTSLMTDHALAERLNAAVIDERKFAILEPDARVRGLTTGGYKRGTAGGELMRSIMQYKSFPLTMTLTHIRRGANQDGYASKVAYLVPFVTGLTLMGAIGLQARQILQGKDPQPIGNKEFWGRAFITGGALGPWGDLLNAAYTRTGNTGIIANLAGPVAGAIEDFSKLGLPNLRQEIEGEKKQTFGAQVASTLRRYTPGTTLWYTRAAVDRMVWDNLQRLMDPDYRQSWRRQEQKARKDYGQDFWWPKGQNLPTRPPAF